MEAESYLLEEYKNLIQRKELCRQNFGKLHLENRQHHFSSSCSGTAHSLVWVSVSGLSSPSLSLLFPPPSPKMLHLPCSLYRQPLMATRTSSGFTSPSLSCFSLWPLRSLEEALGSDAHLSTWLGQGCLPHKQEGVRVTFPQKRLWTEQQITGISNTPSHAAKCVCVQACVCVSGNRFLV